MKHLLLTIEIGNKTKEHEEPNDSFEKKRCVFVRNEMTNNLIYL